VYWKKLNLFSNFPFKEKEKEQQKATETYLSVHVTWIKFVLIHRARQESGSMNV